MKNKKAEEGIWLKNEIFKVSVNGNKFAILTQIEEGENSGEVDKTEIDATVKSKRVEM